MRCVRPAENPDRGPAARRSQPRRTPMKASHPHPTEEGAGAGGGRGRGARRRAKSRAGTPRVRFAEPRTPARPQIPPLAPGQARPFSRGSLSRCPDFLEMGTIPVLPNSGVLCGLPSVAKAGMRACQPSGVASDPIWRCLPLSRCSGDARIPAGTHYRMRVLISSLPRHQRRVCTQARRRACPNARLRALPPIKHSCLWRPSECPYARTRASGCLIPWIWLRITTASADTC